jgi:hypothetical protein
MNLQTNTNTVQNSLQINFKLKIITPIRNYNARQKIKMTS